MLASPIGKRMLVEMEDSPENLLMGHQQQNGDSAIDILAGWTEFTSIWHVLDMTVVLGVALCLGAAIAYHPLTRSKMSSLEELEHPKTFLMYSVVAAVVAQIVMEERYMGLVVFGIGGLLRFRTNVGEAKDTGRVILVTVVGLCCGMKLYVVGTMATLVGWIVIYCLERQIAGRVLVKGLDSDRLIGSARAYHDIIAQAGGTIIRERKKHY